MTYHPLAYAAPNWSIDASASLTGAVMQLATVRGLRLSQLHTESEHPLGPWLVYCDDELIGTVVCE